MPSSTRLNQIENKGAALSFQFIPGSVKSDVYKPFA